jgi:hypothetical protein
MFVPPSHHEYNPYNLPDRMNFHKATRDLPLPRDVRVKFQVYLSRRNKEQIKEILGTLDNMLNEKLTKARISYKNGNIIIPEKLVEKERRVLLREAIYTKAVIEFTNKYYQSLLMQHKV